ncbi:ABC transporter ATP-binding protein [Paenibacillus sp. CAU 1782]
MDKTAVIKAVGICKHFGSHHAVTDVSITVKRGELFAIIGKNGAGKSTLLDMLAGELQPDAGYIVAPGLDISEEPEKLSKVPTAYMPNMLNMEGLTVRGALAGYRHYPKADERIQETLEQYGLNSYSNLSVDLLPPGFRHRLVLAGAMAADPELVLLDEPTTGLDAESKRQYWDLLSLLRSEGKTIIIASHDMTEIARHCDRVAVMKAGKVTACGCLAGLIGKLPYGGMTLEAVYMHHAVGPGGGVEV